MISLFSRAPFSATEVRAPQQGERDERRGELVQNEGLVTLTAEELRFVAGGDTTNPSPKGGW